MTSELKNEVASWVADHDTPSFFGLDTSTKPESLAEFSVGGSMQSYQVTFLKDPVSGGLSIAFEPTSSTGDHEPAPLSLHGNTFVHFDPDRMPLDKADSLLRQAQKSFVSLSETESFMEPKGQGNGSTAESLDDPDSSSDPVHHDYKADAGRMLNSAIDSIPQRNRLDWEVSKQIVEQYEAYRAQNDTLPEGDLTEYEGLIRADLDSRGINTSKQWKAIRNLAGAIVAVQAPRARKERLTPGLAQALFRTPGAEEPLPNADNMA